ncbi:hypothetical protein ACFV2H_04215 [Streptomyces sp. NPDC059629]|uniref:hypothetical protein n=1 Tax=Streptomyces sp. NPDC059629 TaxID=3346889 RepID=UPI003673E6B0
MAGDRAADLVPVVPDPAVEAVVGSWPAVFDNTRAAAPGLEPDPSPLSLVQDHLADQAPPRGDR